MDAALAQHRFQQDGRGVWPNCCPQLHSIVAFNKGHVRNTGTEVDAVLVLPCHGQRAVAAAVVTLAQGHDVPLVRAVVLARMGVRQLQRSLHGLRAPGREEGSAHARQVAQALCQLARVPVGVLGREVHKPGGLFGHRRQQPRMSMTQSVYSQPGHEIQVAVARAVPQVHALAALHHYRKPGVHWHQNLSIMGEDGACFGVLPKCIRH